MKEIINFELAKKLDEAWVMKDIETEYYYKKRFDDISIVIKEETDEISLYNDYYKAPTLSETIDILPASISPTLWLTIKKYWDDIKKYWVIYDFCWRKNIQFTWKTLLEAVGKMLEYLLNNWLLNKNK